MKLIQRITILLTTLVLTVATFLSGQANLSAFNFYKARADESKYTDVLDDLNKISNFHKEDYILDVSDYSLEVLTVAKSEDSVLFVYVYQPSAGNKGVLATSINISTNEKKLEFKNYNLVLVDSNGVFYKYFVSGLDCSTINTFEITSIFRKPVTNSEQDGTLDNDINYISYKVAKSFEFTIDSTANLILNVNPIEVVSVENKYVGFIRFSGGFFSYGDRDMYFVSFGTERDIKDLLEVDLYYKDCYYYSYTQRINSTGTTTNKKIYKPCSCGKEHSAPFNYAKDGCSPILSEKYITLTKDENLKFDTGWFTTEHEYPVIQPTSEFISKNSGNHVVYTFTGGEVVEDYTYSTGVLDTISQTQWTLCFAHYFYDYSYSSNRDYSETFLQHTRVSDVSLLRFKFEDSTGNILDLGVVDNMQSSSSTPSITSKVNVDLDNEFKLIIAFILGLALLIVAWPVVSPVIGFVFKGVFVGVGYILKATFIVITSPFKLFKKRRRK